MNRKQKCGFGLILILVLLFGSVVGVRAEGTTSIAVSKTSMDIGDKVTVTVQGSESATMNIKYNASVLTLSSCDVDGYTTSGNVVTLTATTAKLTFTASGEGKSSIIVSSDTLSGSSTSVNVASATTDTDNSGQTSGGSSDATGPFTIDGVAYVVSERYSSSEIPAGFTKTDIIIEDSTYKELSNGTMILIYLKPASNTSGSGTFYIYDETEQSVTPMVLIGTQEQYVIVLNPEGMLLDTLVDAVCTINDVEVQMYQVAEEDSDFYYVYGVDENGNEGWFEYDSSDESIQRVNTALLSSLAETDNQGSTSTTSNNNTSKLTKLRFAIAVLIFLLVVCIIVMINMKLNHTDADDEMEEQEKDMDLFYKNDNEKTKALFMDLDEEVSSDVVTEEDDEIQSITIGDITGEKDSSKEVAPTFDEDEEEEEHLSRRERKRRRKLEEDIFADYQAPVKSENQEKTSDANNTANEDSQIEILDLNDL